MPALPGKRDAFIAIKRFMTDGDINLKIEEEEILNRWIYCDALLRAKELNEEAIVKKLTEGYGIAPITARRDIESTQKLFADVRKINKKYLIKHHLDRIDEDIQKMRKRLFIHVDKDGKETEVTPDAKELAAYSKLLEAYTYTLNSVPEEAQKDPLPPPIFNFQLAPGQVIEKPMSVDEALAEAEITTLEPDQEGVYQMEEEEYDDTEEA